MSTILGSCHECAYCGWTGEHHDHVPAVSSYWLGNRKRKKAPLGGKWVPACAECNSLLGGYHLVTIQERASHLTDRYEKKYRKLLAQPVWGEEEVARMGPEMQRYIRAKGVQRQILMDRLAHLGTIGRFGPITVADYWERLA
jgi:hypothetical protein